MIPFIVKVKCVREGVHTTEIYVVYAENIEQVKVMMKAELACEYEIKHVYRITLDHKKYVKRLATFKMVGKG